MSQTLHCCGFITESNIFHDADVQHFGYITDLTVFLNRAQMCLFTLKNVAPVLRNPKDKYSAMYLKTLTYVLEKIKTNKEKQTKKPKNPSTDSESLVGF